jgi:hypothetical protein
MTFGLCTRPPGSQDCSAAFAGRAAISYPDLGSRAGRLSARPPTFRLKFRARLAPVGDDGYFQTAHWREARFDDQGFSATLRVGENARSLKVDQISLRYAEHPIEIKNARVFKVDALDQEAQVGRTDDSLGCLPVSGLS